MKVVPLYDAPQHAEQVTEWLWREFGDSLPRAFFESIIDHSQTPGNLPLTFVLVDAALDAASDSVRPLTPCGM